MDTVFSRPLTGAPFPAEEHRHERSRPPRRALWSALWPLALLAVAVLPARVSAATFVVNRTDDAATVTPGTLTLRQAIAAAASSGDPADAVAFDPAVFATPQTIVTEQSSWLIQKSLTIQGPGAGLLAVSGRGLVPVFDIRAGTVRISGLTTRAGNNTIGFLFGPIGGSGGGIAVSNIGTAVTVSDCAIADNFAFGDGGGVAVSGAALTLTNCALSGNRSQAGGAASCRNNGTLTLLNCAVSGNTASRTGPNGPPPGGGGVYNGSGSVFLTNCALVGNRADGTGAVGGGLAVVPPTGTATGTATALLVNCTVAGNAADGGAGVFSRGAAATVSPPFGGSVASTGLLNCTVAGNTAATSGGGLSVGQGDFTARGSVVARNGAPNGQGPDVFSASGAGFTSNGSNLIGVGDGGVGFTNGVNGDQAAPIDPRLGPLQDNGGPTPTLALRPGSPAIDADFSASPPATDQRGAPRPQGARADIGAFEAQDTTPPVTTAAAAGPSFVNGFFRGPVTVMLTATDSASGVAGTFYRIDSGAERTYAGPFTVSGDFEHLVTFYSVDNAGNAEGPAKGVTFRIDTAAPVSAGGTQAVAGGRRVTLSAADNFSGVAGTFFRVDSGPQKTYTGPFVVEGAFAHLVTFFSVDNAGNAEAPAQSLAFTVAN